MERTIKGDAGNFKKTRQKEKIQPADTVALTKKNNR